jgi:large subunit ribosomal protein L1
MPSRSKRYKKDAGTVGKESISLKAGIEKLKALPAVKFDQTVECVLHLGIDPKQADQQIRGAISLPHGTGKKRRVVAFCDDADVEAAKQAGAVEAGNDELVQEGDRWLDGFRCCHRVSQGHGKGW